MNMKVYSTIGLLATSIIIWNTVFADTPQLIEDGGQVKVTSSELQTEYGTWKRIKRDTPPFQDRVKDGIISLKWEYCLNRKLTDGVYHITEDVRKYTGITTDPASSGVRPIPRGFPRWTPNYRTPREYLFIKGGSPCLKYELGGKQYIRHFVRLSPQFSLKSQKGNGLNDVIAVAEDLVKKQGCRHISLVFIYRGVTDFEVTLVDDWRYFAVPPKYRPLDVKELKNQLGEDKMDLSGLISGILHQTPLHKLKKFYLGQPVWNAYQIPVDEQDLYLGATTVEVFDINHVIIKDAIKSVLSCLEDQRHQDEYEKMYGFLNFERAMDNLQALKNPSEY
jgi:hypothetical protein